MPIDRRLVALVTVLCIPCAWMLLASLVWSSGTGRPFSPTGWYYATMYYWRANWWATLWLTLAAVFPTILLIMSLAAYGQWWRLRGRVQRRLTVPRRATAVLPRSKRRPAPLQRGVTDNHGHSDWRSLEDTKKRFCGAERPHGGLAVGEAYDPRYDYAVADVEFDPKDKSTWGMGGKAPLLIDPCTTGARAWHSGEFAPTGSGKSSELVTKALVWTGSSVIFDPTIELGPLLDRALKRHHRKRVFHIGLPDSTKGIRMTGFNVLASIDTTHPEAELHLRSHVARIYNENAATEAMQKHFGQAGSDPFFANMGRSLVTCLLAHLVWSDPDQVEISLATFAAGMATPEDDMISLLHKIYNTSRSAMARRLAGTFMQARAQETFSGIYLNAVSGIEWLFSTAYADLLSVGDFDPRTLLLGNCTAFINIDLRAIQLAPMIPQAIIGSILDTLVTADGHVHSLIALLFDEIDTLKTLPVLKTIRDRGRHYGIVLHGLWQSMHQLFDTWGEAQARAWLDSFSWAAFAGIRATGAGKELSPALGGHGVLAYSEGNNQGQQQPFGLSFGTFSRGQNVNVHEISHPLITAAQLQQDLRADELLVVPDTGMPIRCGRAYWFRRTKIVELLAA